MNNVKVSKTRTGMSIPSAPLRQKNKTLFSQRNIEFLMDLHEQNTISPFFSMKRHLQHKRNYGGNKCNNVSSPLPKYPQCARFTPAVDRIFKGEMRQYCGRKLVGFRTILVCLWHNKKVKFMHKKDSSLLYV